jgi:hypothetical protein
MVCGASIIYSLLFLFCILLIVSTQIAASRRKNLKSDVWTLWLDIRRHRHLNSRDSAFQNGDRFQVLTDFNGRQDILLYTD